jgi:hypothetical protein
VTVVVGDVEVADAIHRHPAGEVEPGERQHRRGGGPSRELQYPVIAEVGDVEVAGGPSTATPAGARTDLMDGTAPAGTRRRITLPVRTKSRAKAAAAMAAIDMRDRRRF